ncbi:MAG: hypothetical protein ACLFV6_03480 [Spirulinaceae cyanobacterium]
MLDAIIDRVGDWNPQLFRELKGQLKPRGLVILGFLSFLVQLLIYLLFASQISINSDTPGYYVTRENGVGTVNWTLWSGDIFVTLSFFAIFILLPIGTYLLTANLAKEAQNGTLNFIRMSPQSALDILIGKMLGVPALLYWGFAIAFPFHFAFGIGAGIPFYQVLGFDLILVAACTFFYSIALLVGLLPFENNTRSSLPWAVSLITLIYLIFIQGSIFSNGSFQSVLDILYLFHPGFYLKSIAADTTYFMFSRTNFIGWYTIDLATATNFLWLLGLANFSLWIYWFAQALKRRFHDLKKPLWSKSQSYCISASFTVISLGFALSNLPDSNHYLLQLLGTQQVLYFFVAMALIIAISPLREQVQIWALHRPQYRRGIASFIFDEKSPAVLAGGINGAILYTGLVVYAIASAVFSSPEGDSDVFLLGTTLVCLVVSWILIVLIASVYQGLLLNKSRRRAVMAKSGLLTMVFLLPLAIFFALLSSDLQPMLAWLFTPFGLFTVGKVTLVEIIFAFVGQSLAIAAVMTNIHNHIYRLGASESQVLLSNKASTAIKS